MSAIHRLLAVSCLMLAATTAAVAQMPTAAQKSAIQSSCRSDFMAHCSGVHPGGQAAFSCLQQNMSGLSAPCQSAVGAISGGAAAAPPGSGPAPSASQQATPRPQGNPRQQLAALRLTCRADYRAFCRDVRPGGGRALGCLRANAPSLSPACRSGLLALQQH